MVVALTLNKPILTNYLEAPFRESPQQRGLSNLRIADTKEEEQQGKAQLIL